MKRPCLEPRCREFAIPTGRGRCKKHAREREGQIDRAGRATYSSKAWQILRRRVLYEEPLCRVCGVMATDVDHINGDPTDNRRENLQPLCHRDHSIKTRAEQIA